MSIIQHTHVPAGWYLDGMAEGSLRWWDGSDWTNDVRPVAAPVLVPVPPMDVEYVPGESIPIQPDIAVQDISDHDVAQQGFVDQGVVDQGTLEQGLVEQGLVEQQPAAQHVIELDDSPTGAGEHADPAIEAPAEFLTTPALSRRQLREMLGGPLVTDAPTDQ
jgi:Protein of unknown function (DUF2510)